MGSRRTLDCVLPTPPLDTSGSRREVKPTHKRSKSTPRTERGLVINSSSLIERKTRPFSTVPPASIPVMSPQQLCVLHSPNAMTLTKEIISLYLIKDVVPLKNSNARIAKRKKNRELAVRDREILGH